MAASTKQKQQVRSFDTHELAPYACHLNQRTVVTKNVELVQFIKLSTNNHLSDDGFRAKVRDALNEHADPSKIALWIHTVRTQKKITVTGSEDFAAHADILWKRALPDELRYANNVYISVVIDFKRFPLWHPQNYLRALNAKAEEKRFNRIIDEREQELTEIADKIIGSLKDFGATKLEVVKRDDGIYYSEQMEFLHKLLTFSDAPIMMPLGDISRNLYKERFSFNLYTGQISMLAENTNSFGAVITLKESHMITANALKDLLNTDYEFVISESIDLAFGNKHLPEYKYQKYVNSLTDDRKFVEIMGGREYEPEPENFAMHQVGIMIMRRSQKDFTRALADINRTLENLGIVSHMEDLHLERSFWAMLPGNFAFLKRQQLVSHAEIGRFASLGMDKFTAIADCMFGEPVTFFENHNGGAFSLHFLNDGQSNLLISGATPDERQILANLITVQGVKLGMNVLFYDESGKYEGFAKSINATYFKDLDLEAIKKKLEPKTLVVINNLKKTVDNLDPFFDFIDFAGGRNAVIIACADYTDNCEALLPNFHTQIFMHGDVEKTADYFDLFEDEIRLIDLLENDSFYFKHGYDELVLNFRPTKELVQVLTQGGTK